MNYTVREMKLSDWDDVSRIYIEGIVTGIATFQTECPTYEAWDAAHTKVCRLVAEDKSGILGWTVLSPTSARPVYAGVAEVSIYISAVARGKGVGKTLLNKLIYASETAGYWTLQSVIDRENIVSIHLHEICGFRLVGYRERIGLRDGVWRDTVLMERRSDKVGV